MKKGFTLVELLVAMAIIGIILGLAVFGISLAQRGGRDTQRRSALEDISVAAADLYSKSGANVTLLGFVQENGNNYVLVQNGPTPIGNVTACDTAATRCVVVPLKGPTGMGSTGYLGSTIFDSFLFTNSTRTKYYFNPNPSDGYFLAACMENGSMQNISTTTQTLTAFTCP